MVYYFTPRRLQSDKVLHYNNMMSESQIKNSSGDQKQNQSLLTVLNKFVQAVNIMDETVMIPSRLKDMDIGCMTENPEILEENNNMALMNTMRPETDLYSFYKLLNTIKKEIISGNSGEEEKSVTSSDSEDDTANESSKTADLFRHHLQGLFTVINQLTDTAKVLTDKYESEFLGDGPSRSITSFAI